MGREELEIDEESGGCGRPGGCGRLVANWCIPKNGEIAYDRGREKYDRQTYADQFDVCDFKICGKGDTKPGNFPYFTIIISIIQSAVFAYYYSDGANINDFNTATFCTPLVWSPWHREEVWRYFTYQFNHAGIGHLIGNLVFQLVLGTLLEIVHGSARIILLYFIGVIAGSLTASVMAHDMMLVGASGGDYALIFAYLANLIINWDSMVSCRSLQDPNKSCCAKIPWKVLRLIFLLSFIGQDIYQAIGRLTGATGQTSIGAHLGGGLAGLTLGIAILHNFHAATWEKYVKWIGVGLFTAFIIFVIIWNIVWPGYEKMDDMDPPCAYFSECGYPCSVPQ